MKKVMSLLICFILLGGLWVTGSAAEAVPKEVVDQAFNLVPLNAYSEGKETLETIKPHYVHCQQALIEALAAQGLIVLDGKPADSDKLEDNPDATRISKDIVVSTFEKLYGPNSFTNAGLDQEKILSGVDVNLLVFDAAKQEYAFIPYPYGGGDPGGWYLSYTEGTKNDTELIVTERRLWYDQGYNTFGFTLAGAYYTGPETYSDGTKVYERAVQPDFAEYLPAYKHVFKENGAGGYYWVSTELVSPAKEIPLSLLPAGSVSNPSTSDGAPVGFAVAALLCLGLAALTVARKRQS